MRALILLLAASALTAQPALAQHHGHHMPAPAKKPAAKKPAAKKAAPKKKPAAKKPVAKKKAAAKKPAAKPKAAPAKAKAQADPHAGHSMPEQAADPHAGHAMPAQTADPHAGHAMPAETADPHAGHAMPAAPAPPVAPPPPAALSGPAHAGDAVWGADMRRSREAMIAEHGGMTAYGLLIDRAETQWRNSRDGFALDLQAWVGGDIDKLWVKGEAEGTWGAKLEQAEVQALWSHAIGPFFDLQTGVRFDAQPGPDRAHAVLGVQGLAPYWWEVDGALFLSNKGELTARAEAEYDLRITQRLILQPRGEIDLSAQKVRELGLGAGLTTAELGLRLRYEITPQFAPYAGIEYERAFGATARYRRAEGDKAGEWRLLTGLRLWF